MFAGLLALFTCALAAQEQQANPRDEAAEPSQAAAAEPSSSISQNDDGARPGDSRVRIVRLSQAQGHIGLDRGTGKVESTMQNMPIVEHSRLATGEDGYAEVEFEDGSTLRLAPDSQVDFPQLILRGTGAKATTVRLVKGTLYVNLEGTKNNEFTVQTGNSTMTVQPSSHMRLETEGNKATLTVFRGDVQMQAGTETASIEKKRSVTFDLNAEPEKLEIAKKVEDAPYDRWDKDAIDYHDRYMKSNAFGSSLYSYGIPDLNYYGSFINSGGCGYMWRPYFVGSAWDPYGNGVWAWYQGAGYSWVSPYPWGWLPYHSGTWAFCPGVGWGWHPGSTWWGLANVNPAMISRPVLDKPGAPARGVVRGGLPTRPPGPERPTGIPRNTLLISNRTPLVFSRMDRPDNFVFEKNSAGLGVPRGSLGNLHRISSHVEHNGFVNHQVYTEPMAGLRSGRAGGTIHPGSPVTIRSGSPGWSRGNMEAWQGRNGAFHGDQPGNPSPGAWRSGVQRNGEAFHGGSPGGFQGGGGLGGGGGVHGSGGASGGSGGGGHK